MKILVKQACRQIQRMRNILVILALFVCTSICLGDTGQTITINGDIVNQNEVRRLKQPLLQRLLQPLLQNQLLQRLASLRKYSDIAGNGTPNSDPDKYKHGKALDDDVWNNPNNNRLIIDTGAKVGDAIGAKMNKASVDKNKDNKAFLSMTNNEIIVSGGNFDCTDTDGDIAGAWADYSVESLMNISSNTVIITGGTGIKSVLGGGAYNKGTVSSNTVTISNSVKIGGSVFGAWIGDGLASSNEVTITGGKVGGDVFGGYIWDNGTATGNKVNLTNVTVMQDVYGAWIGTNKKAEFERAMEEATEAFERVEAHTAKFAKDNNLDELKRVSVDMIAGAGKAITATKDLKYFNSLAAAAAEADITAIDAAFDGVLRTLGEIAETDEVEIVKEAEDERARLEKHIQDRIKEFKSASAKFRGYVIAGIERAEAKRAETYVLASSNKVTINGGRVGWVCGVRIRGNGTATLNTVNLTGVDVTSVDGAAIFGDGYVSSNTVTITSGKVRNVYGGFINNNGTATLNTVNLTDVDITRDVYGAWIGRGLVSSNTVTINGGKIKGNVFGGFVKRNGKAINNTINITGNPEFSTSTILCGGICAPNATTNDAVTGNTLNIETKGVEVKGISNFEKYKFNLKDIKAGETVLTATGGGCSWNIREHNYTSDCAVDLSKSSISSLRTQGVLNKKESFTLIKSPHGFEGEVETKQCDFENEGLLIKYCWDIKIADNKEDLVAILADKKIRDEGFARSLSEGYGAGVVCVNNGMDCIFSKMEETEELSSELSSKEQSPKELSPKEQSPKSLLGLQRKGEIGAFGGLAASKSKYDIDKGSHIDMIGTSMMGGVGKVVEVREKELTVGVFAEHGTGNSDIHYENKNEGKSSYTGGGLLGRYNIYENEFSGTKELSSGLSSKIYVEAILRAGQVENKFESKKMKDSKGKEYKYKYADAMYRGCALGGGCKHKVSEKIDLDWSLRYMFGRQWEKDVKREDADGNRMKFKNVTSNRIRIGVRGKYVELEKIKPYAGIGCEYELDGKVKGAIQNGKDMIDMPVSDFGGVTGIGELGVSGKVWKFGVDISGQGYLGVRKGFGGMLKLKYAFGKR